MGLAVTTLPENLSPQALAWHEFMRRRANRLSMVSNADVVLQADELDGHALPVTLGLGASSQDSWIVSLTNAYGPYARAELDRSAFKPVERAGLRAASYLGEAALHLAGLDSGMFLNSWQVSTDLLAAGWTAEGLTRKAVEWAKKVPDAPVILRSLNAELHGKLLPGLKAAGWQLLPTRQVWLTDVLCQSDWRKRSDVKKDLSFERRATGFHWTSPRHEDWSSSDFGRAQDLYERLYRGKYPVHNPSYSEEFLRLGDHARWLELEGLRDSASGQLVGVLGYIVRDGVLTTPILGYDLAVPQEAALYRRLSLRVLLVTEERGLRMHSSAGAGRFKQSRGAKPYTEFAAVWAEHMPRRNRSVLSMLARGLERYALPQMESRIL